MEWMFSGCYNLTILDLSSFNISNVTKFEYMFNAMSKTTVVKVKDEITQDWILSSLYNNRPEAWTTENVIIKEV